MLQGRAKRIALWIASPVLALILILVVVVAAFFHTFYPSVAGSKLSPARDVLEAQHQDFAYFRQYLDYNKSYSDVGRAEAAKLIAANEANSAALSQAQFDLVIARAAALADNGHSTVFMGPLSRRHGRLPCRFYHFADGYYVIRAHAACAPLLGAKLIAIDGRPIDAIADALFQYSGGPRNHYDQFKSVFFLESPELLHAAGLAEASDKATLQIRLQDGSERKVTMPADPADASAPRVYSDSYLSPQRIDGEAKDWTPLLGDETRLPMFLRNYATPFQASYLADEGVAYIQFKSNADEEGYPIGAFVARAEKLVDANKPRTIILDLRLDQGGNFLTTASFMKHIADMALSVRHVYVLTSAWTFSAGNVSLALAKYHGGDKVTIVGEPVGDRTRIWAEGGAMTLPNSRLGVGFATGLHDYTQPCWGQSGCFWPMAYFPLHLKSWEPDVNVAYSFADYMALRDPALDRALLLARTGHADSGRPDSKGAATGDH